jgi:iron complex outermembrane receptor protein
MTICHTAFRRTTLSLCIAAPGLLLSTTLLAQPAPQNQNAIDTIVVTGSRSLERSILESPVPVDTFSAEDVRDSGALAGELGEALATLVPSFNFLRQSNSGTSDHVRAGQLRGLSPDQMLVLVNGKRRHTSAVVNSETKIGRGTAAVDFNTLPLNAVHHVEVLRDGAGAQYGSDAIGGVVNLILDRESVRPEFNVGYGAHVTDFDAIDEKITDGQTLTLDGKAGLTLTGGGFLNAGFDVKRREATDRAGFDLVPFFIPATPANLALQGERNYAKGDPEVRDANFWFNGEQALGANILYAFGTLGRRDTEGATFFRYPDESRNVPAVYPQGYRPVTTGENRDHSVTLGMSSRLGDWATDTSATLGGNRFAYGAKNSLNASYGAASPTRFDSGEYLLDQLTVNADIQRATPYDTAFGTLHVAAGAEYRKEKFRTRAGEAASWQAGPFSADIGAQGAIGLTPADEAREAREVYSVYVNVADQLTDRLLLDTAARLEHYSDFGDELSGKASVYYELADGYGLRGALSNSLRAPALSQIGFSDRSTNFGDNRSLVNTVTLPVANPLARLLGASALKPETSVNSSIGLTAQPGRSVTLTIDAFQIDVDDRITLSDRLFGAPLVNFVQAQPGGAGIESVRFFTNAIDTRTRGIDLIVTHEAPLFDGDLALTFGYSYAQTEIASITATPAQLLALDPGFRLIGVEEINTIEESAPRQKSSLLTTWSRDKLTLVNRIHYFGSVVRVFNFGGGFEPRQRYGSEVGVDIEGSYLIHPGVTFTLGVNNVFDNYADLSSADINFFGNLPHDVLSPIGESGRYVYSSLNMRF